VIPGGTFALNPGVIFWQGHPHRIGAVHAKEQATVPPMIRKSWAFIAQQSSSQRPTKESNWVALTEHRRRLTLHGTFLRKTFCQAPVLAYLFLLWVVVKAVENWPK
jgi:hypothetical protein